MTSNNTIKNTIYRAVESVLKKRYTDDSWEGIQGVKDIIYNVLNDISTRDARDLSVVYNVNNGGYASHNGGFAQHKTWNFDIEEDGSKVLLKGKIVAYACGGLNDPWSSYDISVEI